MMMKFKEAGCGSQKMTLLYIFQFWFGRIFHLKKYELTFHTVSR